MNAGDSPPAQSFLFQRFYEELKKSESEVQLIEIDLVGQLDALKKQISTGVQAAVIMMAYINNNCLYQPAHVTKLQVRMQC